MPEVLDEVRRLKQVVEDRTRDRMRLEAERDAAKARHEEALATLKGFGVETLEDAEALLEEKEATIAEQVEVLMEALG